MKDLKVDLLIIGAGPAGLAAGIEAKKRGLEKILILERNEEPGGILQQCIHDGFGLHRFGEQLSGPAYAQRFIDEAERIGLDYSLSTMVIELYPDKTAYAINNKDGLMKIQAKAVILAMGCRERSRMQIMIMGSRPHGVMSAGTVQRYINMEGLIPGKKAVILGSGDIGLIMARRMTLEGIEVEGVYELMDRPGGLARNIFQCLDDYNIPLHLSTTVTQIHGKFALEGVTVAQVDKERKVIDGTERYIPCDLLVLSVGLIPENELSLKAHVELSPVTSGPVVDNYMMTKPGFFCAGNVSMVFDLVDYVSDTGETAARSAVEYINGRLPEKTCSILQGEGVAAMIPMEYRPSDENLNIYCRTKDTYHKARVKVTQGSKELFSRRFPILRPQEMVVFSVKNKPEGNEDIVVSIESGDI